MLAVTKGLMVLNILMCVFNLTLEQYIGAAVAASFALINWYTICLLELKK